MKIDYHMHFEYGDYDLAWVKGFFQAAKKRGLAEIGISEHTHTFPEFKELYYEDLILDDSFVGSFQQKWLKKNKFKHTLEDYFAFMRALKERGYKVKTGIEVCNFHNQERVKELLAPYNFDYIIGSVHFIQGWAYDSIELREEWSRRSLRDIYEAYTEEIVKLCQGGIYDVLGHPYNIRLYRDLPDFDVTPYLKRAIEAIKKANMAIDINTGTLYRYPIKEISPCSVFMELASKENIPIITSSDAHKPEDCGSYIDEAIAYVKGFGYQRGILFDQRKRQEYILG